MDLLRWMAGTTVLATQSTCCGAVVAARCVVASSTPLSRAAISRNNMLNTNYTNPSITTIAWSPPGISPTCSSVLAVVGDDHTLKVYGPAVLGNATWALHEDVGAALKQQLRAANWRAAGDLEEPEVPDDDMPVVPVVKPGRGGRKRKVVEVVKEVEEVEEVEEEEPEAPVTPAAPKKVKPVATTAKAPAAPKAPATPATPTAPAGAAAPPEDDECRYDANPQPHPAASPLRTTQGTARPAGRRPGQRQRIHVRCVSGGARLLSSAAHAGQARPHAQVQAK